MLYFLVITDKERSAGNATKDYFIGFFRSEQVADSVAKRYLSGVRGFCDYPCEYQIIEKEVIDADASDDIDEVWIVTGWNEQVENNISKYVDYIQSDCYVDKDAAVAERDRLQSDTPRKFWAVESWNVGTVHWRDGFVR